VRFLVDNNLSPQVAVGLNRAGHDAVHLREYGMQASTDTDVLARASAETRVLVSADTDFGVLLARQRATSPSVLLIRRRVGRRAAEQVTVIVDNLDAVTADLIAGAVVVLADDRIRIRRLPFLPG
jgi:predicted nuclease of predicted toxin-antitoxin system